MTNYLELLLDNFEKDISLEIQNNDEEEIKPADTTANDDKNSSHTNIDKQRPTTPNWIPQNRLPSELSLNLKEVMFSKSELLVDTPILNTRYLHSGSQSSNFLYPFNDRLDYALTHYFARSETIKPNIDKFLSNPLMKLITKKLSYRNIDEWIEKLFTIPWEILDNKCIQHKFNRKLVLTNSKDRT